MGLGLDGAIFSSKWENAAQHRGPPRTTSVPAYTHIIAEQKPVSIIELLKKFRRDRFGVVKRIDDDEVEPLLRSADSERSSRRSRMARPTFP